MTKKERRRDGILICVNESVTVRAGANCFCLRCLYRISHQPVDGLCWDYTCRSYDKLLWYVTIYPVGTWRDTAGANVAASESWADLWETVSVPALFVYVNLFVACERAFCGDWTLLRVLLNCVVAIGTFVDVLQTVIVHASCRTAVCAVCGTTANQQVVRTVSENVAMYMRTSQKISIKLSPDQSHFM